MHIEDQEDVDTVELVVDLKKANLSNKSRSSDVTETYLDRADSEAHLELDIERTVGLVDADRAELVVALKNKSSS